MNYATALQMYVSAYQEKHKVQSNELLDARVLTQAKDQLKGEIALAKIQEYDELLAQQQVLREGLIAEQQMLMDKMAPVIKDFFANSASAGASAIIGGLKVFMNGENVAVAPAVPT